MLLETVFPYIIAVLGLVSPIALQLIQGHQKREEKKLELYYENKFNIYRTFAEAYSRLYENSTYDQFWDFSAKAYSAILVSDRETGTQIAELISAVKRADLKTSDETEKLFGKCVRMMNESHTAQGKKR